MCKLCDIKYRIKPVCGDSTQYFTFIRKYDITMVQNCQEWRKTFKILDFCLK